MSVAKRNQRVYFSLISKLFPHFEMDTVVLTRKIMPKKESKLQHAAFPGPTNVFIVSTAECDR